MLVHDTSGSMQATDVKPDRLSAAREAARTFVALAAGGVPARGGLVQHRAPSSCPSRRPTARRSLRALDALEVEGGTAMGDGLRLGIEAIRAPVIGVDGPRAAAAGRDRAALRRREHEGRGPAQGRRGGEALKIPIYAVALGTQNGDAAPDGRRRRRCRPTRRRSSRSRARPAGASSPRRPRATSRRCTPTSAGGSRRARRSRRSRRRSPAAALALLLAGLVTGLLRNGRLPMRRGSPRAGAHAGAARARGRSRTRSCARSTSR